MADTQLLEETSIEEQQQVPLQEEPPLKKLYNGLYKDGKYTKSFDDFKSKFSNIEERKKLHKGLVEDGDYTKGISDFDNQYFPTDIKKKVGGEGYTNGSFPSTSELYGGKKPNTARLDGLPEINIPQPKGEQKDPFALPKKVSQRLDGKEEVVTPVSKKIKDNSLMNMEGIMKPASLDDAYYQDKDNESNRSGYLLNKFLGGIGKMSSGMSDLMMQGMLAIAPDDARGGISKEQALKNFRAEGTPLIQESLKNQLGSTVTTEQQKKYDNETITSAVGGIAETLPAMVGYKGIPMFLQAYDNGLTSINSTEEGKKLPESTKTVFGMGVGFAQAALE